MANENAQLAEFADNLWKNYLRQKVLDETKNVLMYYRAKCLGTLAGGKMLIQRPYDERVTVRCTAEMEDATVGDQVLVIQFGNGVAKNNHLVVAYGDGSLPNA